MTHKSLMFRNIRSILRGGRVKVTELVCPDCIKLPEVKSGFVVIDLDSKAMSYQAIIALIKDRKAPIEFIEAVKLAYNAGGAIKSYIGPEGVSENNRRLWPFRYDLTHNEANIRIVKENPLFLEWVNK